MSYQKMVVSTVANSMKKTLTSSMTIDDAYLLVTGMSYNQFKEYEKTEIEKMKKGEKKESSRENILECKSNKIIC